MSAAGDPVQDETRARSRAKVEAFTWLQVPGSGPRFLAPGPGSQVPRCSVQCVVVQPSAGRPSAQAGATRCPCEDGRF